MNKLNYQGPSFFLLLLLLCCFVLFCFLVTFENVGENWPNLFFFKFQSLLSVAIDTERSGNFRAEDS